VFDCKIHKSSRGDDFFFKKSVVCYLFLYIYDVQKCVFLQPPLKMAPLLLALLCKAKANFEKCPERTFFFDALKEHQKRGTLELCSKGPRAKKNVLPGHFSKWKVIFKKEVGKTGVL